MNKKTAEAIVINHTPQNKKSKAKPNTVSPLQGTGDIGKLFGILIPKRACDRAAESDECPGDERLCVAYYERPAKASVQGASA
eukprot:7121908-Heterocapsa_arctica.AAC.1